MRFAVQTKTQLAMIVAIQGMGEGVEDYAVHTQSGVQYYHVPLTDSPEKEWEALSDIGKEEVREQGWVMFGGFEYVLARTLRQLGFSEADAQGVRDKLHAEREQFIADISHILRRDVAEATRILSNNLDLKRFEDWETTLRVWDSIEKYEDNGWGRRGIIGSGA